MKKKAHQLILVPEPGAGHLVSTIEFAKTLIHLDPQLFISLLIIKLPFTPFVEQYITSLTHSQPNIRLIHVPKTDHPPSQPVGKDREGYICAYIESHKHLVRNIIHNLISDSDSVPVIGLVLDLFCPSLIDLGDEFGIPSFIFLTSGATFLNLMFYLPSRDEKFAGDGGLSFSGSSDLSIPGFQNLVPAKVLPQAVFNEDGGYEAYMKIAEGFLRVKGIIVNTFTDFESYAIESYKTGNYPKVYPVGPLVNLTDHPNPEMDKSEWDKIMKWLDDQPESSVVFLCFGSSGSFDGEQIKEIAMGLEQSGHKFVWCVRSPSPELKNPKDMLPEGWFERVKGRGMISGWAPQVEVLNHKAIGGFVSHCGWNSILESAWFGVPIATLPIYAEQQLNAFTLVKELGIAVEVKLDYRRGCKIGKEEVEKGIRGVMDSESERKKVKDLSRIARMVKLDGGSSFNSLSEFIRDVRQ